MLIQGSNNPLVIKFDQDVDGLSGLVVTLWTDSAAPQRIKTWTLAEMEVEGNEAVCPITEAETAAIEAATVMVEAKGLNEDGYTVFWDAYKLKVKSRRDRVITLTGVS